LSTFKRPQEFYVYAIHAIYAIILASSYQILEDAFVPIPNALSIEGSGGDEGIDSFVVSPITRHFSSRIILG
jgi:hypothetical protein